MEQLNDYMSTKAAAALWQISQRRVLALCAGGRIPGAVRFENRWFIPKEVAKPQDGRSKRPVQPGATPVRPFVKWAGGKSQLLTPIRQSYPLGLGSSITKYAEPFVGGGAILWDILSRYHLSAVYISDINGELTNAYRAIRDESEGLIQRLSVMEQAYLPLDETGRKAYYYQTRQSFNQLQLSGESKKGLDGAAYFIFLNRTCFNGLYRVNRKGLFNVPMGAYAKPLICDEANLRRLSQLLQPVEIVCGDYQKATTFIDGQTFVYFDPPYRPLNATSGFTSYSENGFDDHAQIALAEFITAMAAKGAKILLSNSDPKNADIKDDFFDDLYQAYCIKRVDAARAINSNREKRGKIKELLIANYSLPSHITTEEAKR